MFLGRATARICPTHSTSALMNSSLLLVSHSLRRKTGSLYALPAFAAFIEAFYQMEKLFFCHALAMSQELKLPLISFTSCVVGSSQRRATVATALGPGLELHSVQRCDGVPGPDLARVHRVVPEVGVGHGTVLVADEAIGGHGFSVEVHLV